MKHLLFSLLIGFSLLSAQAQIRPNIIFILCDDLGIGDLGVTHQDTRAAAGLPAFDTPQLDTMAGEGAILNRHYTAAPVCAPARASFLLGVHQGHANIRDNQFDRELEDNHTVGSVLQAAGYATAVIGKWGLQGGPDKAGTPDSPSYPTKRGFDYFFGYLDHSAGHRHYPKEDPADAGDPDGGNTVWDDGVNVTQDLDLCYSTDLFTARAKQWIVDQRTDAPDQPFFLYLAYTAPHAALQVPTQTYPSGGGLNGGLQWTGTSGAMINTASGNRDSWIHPDFASTSWTDSAKRHATMVRRIDSGVGDLLQLLDDLGIGDNTLVVFTSDNGPHLEGSWTGIAQNPQFFQSYGTLDGTKRDTWEAGIRVPTLVRWPDGIPAGRTTDHASQFHDWLPTFAALAQTAPPARTDGVSLIPVLTGQGTQREGTVYVEYSVGGSTPNYVDFDPSHRGVSWNQQQVVHVDGYKAVRRNTTTTDTVFRVFDLDTDSEELTDLAGQPEVPSQQDLEAAVLRLRRPSSSIGRVYDNTAVPGFAGTAGDGGLHWRRVDGSFDWVPDVKALTPDATGVSAGLELSLLPASKACAIEWSGYLNVAQTGSYTFRLQANGQAFLRLHAMQVIDADFGYQGDERAATVQLEAGMHPIRLTYVPDAASPALSLRWSGPGLAETAIPDDAFARTLRAAPAHWKLEEGSGGTTRESGSGIDSADFQSTGISWSTETPGYASTASLSFPGSAGVGVNTGLSAADLQMDGSNGKTLLAWIRAPDAATNRFFLGWAPTDGATPGSSLRLGLTDSGYLRFEVSSGYALFADRVLDDGEWHLVGVVIQPEDRTSDIQFYIDGDLLAPTEVQDQVINTLGTGTAPRDVWWLGLGNPGGGREWPGELDEVRILPYAVTEAELDQWIREMRAVPLTARWELDEGEDTQITDAVSGTSSNAWGNGVVWTDQTAGPGSAMALSFSGAADARVKLNRNGSDTGVGGSGAKTLVAWFRTTAGDRRSLLGWSPGGGGVPGGDLRLILEDGGKFRFEVSSGFAKLESPTLNDGEWHIAAVIVEEGDRIDQVQFYIDGTLYDPPGNNQQSINTSGSGAGTASNPNSWYLGSSGNVDKTNWLGEIDGVRIYAVALSKADLDAIRLDGREGVGYYRWIRQYYPGETNPTVIGFGADPDQDGISNGLEYILGEGVNVPNAADVLPEPQASVQGDAFVYSFERPDGAEGEDVTLVVESGPDLVTWPERYVVGKDAVDSDPQVRILENANGRDQVEVWFPLQTMMQRFVRLWVDG